MQFNEKLIILRKQKGMTQEQLAFEANVSRQSVSKWELGDCIPDVSKLRELSRVFGVSIDYLLNEEQNEVQNVNSAIDQSRSKTEKFLAQSTTVYTTEMLSTSYRLFTKYADIIIGIATIVSLFFCICHIFLESTKAAIFMAILSSVCAMIYLIHFRRKKQYIQQGEGVKSTVEYHSDQLIIRSEFKDGESMRSIRYDLLKKVFVKEKIIYCFCDGFYFIVDLKNIQGDSSGLSEFYAHCKVQLPQLTAKGTEIPRKLKSIKILSIVLSPMSLFMALITISGLMSNTTASASTGGLQMTEHMWIFFLYLPITVGTVILGFYLLRKKYKGRVCVILGSIMSVLLFLYGCFFFIFGVNVSHDYRYAATLEKRIGIELPNNGQIISGDGIWGVDSYGSTLVFTDNQEINTFYTSIQSSGLWKNDIDNINVDLNLKIFFLGYDYYLVYNETIGEYNTTRNNAADKLIFLAYNNETATLEVLEYTVAVQ